MPDRLHRRAGHSSAGPDAAAARFPHHHDVERDARRSSSRAGVPPSRSRCGCLTVVVLVLPLVALLLTSLVPAVGVPLTAQSATLVELRFVLFDHAAAKRAFVNSFGLSATAAVVIVAGRRAARLFPRLAPLAAVARAQPGRRNAVRAARRRARDRRDSGVPEAAAAARPHALQHRLDHPVRLSRALSGAGPASGDQRLSPARPHARGSRADRRRAPVATAWRRSSCRWSRRWRPPARC